MKLGRVAVVSKFGSRESEDAAVAVTRKLLDMGADVFTISPVLVDGAERVDSIEDLRDSSLDLAITLGGDGTTLRAFRNLDDTTPLLAINVGGNRGILSEITMDDLDSALDQIASGRVILERRTRVVAHSGGRKSVPALNEILIQRTNLTKTAEIEIKFQNDYVKQKMDGVIVATPSGSTGHSFSLGGPILHESLNVLIITPVAPVYRLESIVVPDEKIEIVCSHDCNVAMDAQVVWSVGFGETITIKRHETPAIFVRLKKRGLRQMSKLGF